MKSSMPVVVFYSILIVLFILLFKSFNANKAWFEKAGSYWTAFMEQKDAEATIEDRKRERLNGPYIVSKAVEDYFRKNNIDSPLILFEPNEYLKANNIISFSLPEPIVFYNFTGLKSVLMNSKNVSEATHIVYITQKGLQIVPITTREQLDQIQDKYKQYKVGL